MAPTAQAIAADAKALRARGAQIIVVVAHIGSACKDTSKPTDLSSCKTDEELFKVIGDLPKGLVDVWVGGHTHAMVAHRIDNIATIESLSSGRAFGRVDLRITDTHVSGVQIHSRSCCARSISEGNPAPVADCHPEPYEGKPVVAERRRPKDRRRSERARGTTSRREARRAPSRASSRSRMHSRAQRAIGSPISCSRRGPKRSSR